MPGAAGKAVDIAFLPGIQRACHRRAKGHRGCVGQVQNAETVRSGAIVHAHAQHVGSRRQRLRRVLLPVIGVGFIEITLGNQLAVGAVQLPPGPVFRRIQRVDQNGGRAAQGKDIVVGLTGTGDGTADGRAQRDGRARGRRHRDRSGFLDLKGVGFAGRGVVRGKAFDQKRITTAAGQLQVIDAAEVPVGKYFAPRRVQQAAIRVADAARQGDQIARRRIEAVHRRLAGGSQRGRDVGGQRHQRRGGKIGQPEAEVAGCPGGAVDDQAIAAGGQGNQRVARVVEAVGIVKGNRPDLNPARPGDLKGQIRPVVRQEIEIQLPRRAQGKGIGFGLALRRDCAIDDRPDGQRQRLAAGRHKGEFKGRGRRGPWVSFDQQAVSSRLLRQNQIGTDAILRAIDHRAVRRQNGEEHVRSVRHAQRQAFAARGVEMEKPRLQPRAGRQRCRLRGGRAVRDRGGIGGIEPQRQLQAAAHGHDLVAPRGDFRGAKGAVPDAHFVHRAPEPVIVGRGRNADTQGCGGMADGRGIGALLHQRAVDIDLQRRAIITDRQVLPFSDGKLRFDGRGLAAPAVDKEHGSSVRPHENAITVTPAIRGCLVEQRGKGVVHIGLDPGFQRKGRALQARVVRHPQAGPVRPEDLRPSRIARQRRVGCHARPRLRHTLVAQRAGHGFAQRQGLAAGGGQHLKAIGTRAAIALPNGQCVAARQQIQNTVAQVGIRTAERHIAEFDAARPCQAEGQIAVDQRIQKDLRVAGQRKGQIVPLTRLGQRPTDDAVHRNCAVFIDNPRHLEGIVDIRRVQDIAFQHQGIGAGFRNGQARHIGRHVEIDRPEHGFAVGIDKLPIGCARPTVLRVKKQFRAFGGVELEQVAFTPGLGQGSRHKRIRGDHLGVVDVQQTELVLGLMIPFGVNGQGVGARLQRDDLAPLGGIGPVEPCRGHQLPPDALQRPCQLRIRRQRIEQNRPFFGQFEGVEIGLARHLDLPGHRDQIG